MNHLGRVTCCTLAVLVLSVGAAYAKPPKKKTHAKPATTAVAPAASAAQPALPPTTIIEPIAVTKPAPPAATVVAPKAATVAAPAASTAPPPDSNLATVSGMAEAGAPRIALEIMDRDQPDVAKDPAGWMSWERERIYIYQTSQAWKAVIDRVGQLPEDATPDFRAWETMQAADAWLHLGDGQKALALVQPLVWDVKSPPDDRTLASLRQLIIRSYTEAGKLHDARAFASIGLKNIGSAAALRKELEDLCA